MKPRLDAASAVHFVGIGGAGMSAIAKVLLERGMRVSGSDIKRSRASTALEAMGADVRIGHDVRNIDELMPDLTVISAAISDTNPEVIRCRELGVPLVQRGEALADLLSAFRSVIVAGTHGKTTTTSMIVSILLAADMDPTYLIGGGLNDVGTNARAGRWDVAVAESDESDGSFLLLRPAIAVVTNVEADHLDHWGSVESLRNAFETFLNGLTSEGVAIVPAADPWAVNVARASGATTVTFDDGGDVSASDIHARDTGMSFTLHAGGAAAGVVLHVPGRHNVSNALAAAAACIRLGLSPAQVADGLARFRGVERRFQTRGSCAGITVVDDYAHHPTEVRATLSAARPGPWRRVVAVFQPHRYSRTEALWRDFGTAFADADRVLVTDVYAAGEQPVPGVSGKLVSDAVCDDMPGRPVAYLPHRDDLVAYLGATARPGDLVLTLGAGDIYSVGDELLERLAGGTR